MTTKVGLYKDKRNKRRPWIVRWFGEYDAEEDKQRQYSRAFARKRDAEAFQATKQTELDRGGTRDRPKDLSVGDFVRHFLESKIRNRRPATRYNYSLTLGQLVSFVGEATPLRSLTPEVADCFIATRTRVANTGSGYSPWSRNRQLGNVKVAFNTAVRWGHLNENPFSHIKQERAAPRKWHYLKPTEFGRILAVVDNLRWRVFYFLAYTTGARFGELFSLTWADVDFQRSTVTIQDRPASAAMPPFQVKNYEARKLLLPRQSTEALLALQAEALERVPYILITPDRWKRVQERWRLCRAGKPWKTNGKTGAMERGEWENRFMVNNVIRDIRSHVRWADLQLTAPLTIHTFRKSFGQNHADAGTPMHTLQKLMGHASITTTREFYLQTADANDVAALARYENLMETSGAETCVKLACEQDPDHSGPGSTPVKCYRQTT